MEGAKDWLLAFRTAYDFNRGVYQDIRQDCSTAEATQRSRLLRQRQRWGSAINNQAETLIEFAKVQPAPAQAALFDLANAVRKGDDIGAQLCAIAATLPTEGPRYLGDGRIEINGSTHYITAQNDQLFVETLLDKGGAALTGALEKAGVSNASTTAARLLKWERGILAPYIETPNGKKGAGYRTMIIDARN